MIITQGNLILGLGNDPKKGYFKFQLMLLEKLIHEELMQLSQHSLETKVPPLDPSHS